MVGWRRFTLVLGSAFGIAAHSASAQVARRWSADATLGAAAVEGGKFFTSGKATVHLSAAGRLLQRGRLSTDVEVGYDWLGRFGLLGTNPDQQCVVDSPGSGCRPPYPDVAGPSASVVLVYAPTARIETRIGGGGGAYSVEGTRVGAVVGQVDAAVLPTSHVGVVVGVRALVIPRYQHDRLAAFPVLVGLRVR